MQWRVTLALIGFLAIIPSASWASGCSTTTTFNTNGSSTAPFNTNTFSSNLNPCPVLQGYNSGALDTAPGTANTSAALPIQGVSGGVAVPVSGTFWQTTQPVSLNATPSLANGNGEVPTQGGAVLSATNGLYANLLAGNVALPTAAALADATSNPTTTILGSANFGYNGSTWDRLRDDTNKYLYVDLGTALPTGANAIGNLAPASSTTAGYGHQVSSSPTFTTSGSYTAGQCFGGFNSVTVVGNNAESAFLTNVRVISASGVSGMSFTLYEFDANPSSSTCTDHGTFTLSGSDVDKLIANPVSMTLVAPTGSTPSMAEATFIPPRPFLADNGAAGQVLYYALVANGSFTASGTSGDVHTDTGVVQN